MHRELLRLEVDAVEHVEHGAQRADAAVARDLQAQVGVVGDRAVEAALGAGELVGDGWVVLAHVPPGSRAPTAEHLVVVASLVAVRGLGRPLVRDEGRLPERTLGSVLRAWCRDRSQVSVLLTEGEVVAGLASAAYADHLELSTGGGATVAIAA